MAVQDQEQITEIKASAATPEELSWVEHQRKENQTMLNRLEDAAKYMAGLSSVSLTIMLGPYKDVFRDLNNSVGLKTGITCWLLSILCTLAVVFPFRYRYITNSAGSIKAMNKKMATVKFAVLVTGTLFFMAGISIVAFIYLFG